jgi:hypothetical protein
MGELAENGLLPKPESEYWTWLAPNGPSTGTAELTVLATDIAEVNTIVWPALPDGQPTPPPAEHVLDYLVRREIAGLDARIEAELMLHPEAGTVGVVDKLPGCDLCEQADGADMPARYDAVMVTTNSRTRAFMCPDCFKRESASLLGRGHGQYLLLDDEVSTSVQVARERARQYWRACLDKR